MITTITVLLVVKLVTLDPPLLPVAPTIWEPKPYYLEATLKRTGADVTVFSGMTFQNCREEVSYLDHLGGRLAWAACAMESRPGDDCDFVLPRCEQ